MQNIWIEEMISSLGGIIVIILQLGFIAILTLLFIMVVAEIIKAAIKRSRKDNGKKKQ